MAKIILMLGEKQLREIPLSKERVTIGRRSHNDIVIDDLAISGEHAVIVSANDDSFLEDLNSTNGTTVNGQPVRRHYLQHQDCIELAAYRLHYLLGPVETGRQPGSEHTARLKVLSGSKAGREIVLNKAITSIGKADMHAAAILWRDDGFFLAHVDGDHYPEVNGVVVGAEPRKLTNGDIINISDDRLEFLLP